MAVDDFSIGNLMFVGCKVWKFLIGGVMKEELICKVYYGLAERDLMMSLRRITLKKVFQDLNYIKH
ncbi:hypothetical protein C1H46_012289 [Malus baccata]|uniref:Uncharacterized protein n=1 Tax=Malus baccata TaxID=106549 RepID=A0A540MV38_MALBA|nr:hypothetical protein C1H46_012289 [Malus baccata]